MKKKPITHVFGHCIQMSWQPNTHCTNIHVYSIDLQFIIITNIKVFQGSSLALYRQPEHFDNHLF